MIYEINYPKKYKNKLVCLVITLTYKYHHRDGAHSIVVFYQMFTCSRAQCAHISVARCFYWKNIHFSYKESVSKQQAR